MLEGHRQRPERRVREDWFVPIAQVWVSLDDVPHRLVDLPPVSVHLAHGGPERAALVRVVPRHLVDARLEEGLKLRIDGMLHDAGKPQLVDVQGGGMAVVKDQWQTQMVVRLQVEGRLALQRGKEELGQCPRVVQVA